jgi:hypothetical protein
MAEVLVLKSDWNSSKDPVPYYGVGGSNCLDFNSHSRKPRAALHAVGEVRLSDCEHGVDYEVVICEVG